MPDSTAVLKIIQHAFGEGVRLMFLLVNMALVVPMLIILYAIRSTWALDSKQYMGILFFLSILSGAFASISLPQSMDSAPQVLLNILSYVGATIILDKVVMAFFKKFFPAEKYKKLHKSITPKYKER